MGGYGEGGGIGIEVTEPNELTPREIATDWLSKCQYPAPGCKLCTLARAYLAATALPQPPEYCDACEDAHPPNTHSPKGLPPEMEERIAEISARENESTHGSWVVYPLANPLNALGKERIPNAVLSPELWILTDWVHPQLKAQMPIVTVATGPYMDRPVEMYIRPEDAEFIAHSRTDIPWLLDTIRTLQGQQAECPWCSANEKPTLARYKAMDAELSRLRADLEAAKLHQQQTDLRISRQREEIKAMNTAVEATFKRMDLFRVWWNAIRAENERQAECEKAIVESHQQTSAELAKVLAATGCQIAGADYAVMVVEAKDAEIERLRADLEAIAAIIATDDAGSPPYCADLVTRVRRALEVKSEVIASQQRVIDQHNETIAGLEAAIWLWCT